MILFQKFFLILFYITKLQYKPPGTKKVCLSPPPSWTKLIDPLNPVQEVNMAVFRWALVACHVWNEYQPFSIFMGFSAGDVVTSSAEFSDPIVFEFRVKAKVDISVSLEWLRLTDTIVLGADVYSQLSILCIASISICLWLISLLLFIVRSLGMCSHSERCSNA